MLATPELWTLIKKTNDPVERARLADQFGLPSTNAELSQTGFLDLLDAFSPQETADIRAYFSNRPAYDKAGYITNLLVRDLLTHPTIMAGAVRYRELAKDYLGCEPVLGAVAAFWTSPENESSYNVWHRDRDDFRFLKVFIYITDVDEDSGPHQFIKGSHNPGLPEVLYSGNCRAVQGIDNFFKGRIDTIMGPAGKTWAEDTYGLHKGLRPTKRPRCLLEYLYTQNAHPVHNKRFDGFKLDTCPSHLTRFFQHVL